MQVSDLSRVVKERLDPEDTTLVHGTSIEAVLEFLNTGKMVNSKESSDRNNNDGFLFFFANRDHFEGHPLYGKFDDLDWDGHIISYAESYATLIAVDHYIKNQTGFNPESRCVSPQLLFEYEESEADRILHDLALYDKGDVVREFHRDQHPPNVHGSFSRALEDKLFLEREITHLERDLHNYKTNISQLKWGIQDRGYSLDQTSQIIEDSKKRRGVLLGFSRDVFELNIEEGIDLPEEEVRISLPGGLDIKYINGIVPLGTTEKNMLIDYVGK